MKGGKSHLQTSRESKSRGRTGTHGLGAPQPCTADATGVTGMSLWLVTTEPREAPATWLAENGHKAAKVKQPCGSLSQDKAQAPCPRSQVAFVLGP